MGNVMVIPARRQVGNTVKQSAQKKLRVAAYCRVSTDSEEQETSYEAQVTHYTEYILVLCQVLGQIKRGLFVLIQPGPDPSSTIVSDRQSHIDSVIGNRNDCGSEPCCKMC